MFCQINFQIFRAGELVAGLGWRPVNEGCDANGGASGGVLLALQMMVAMVTVA
jgi:hypothetical protein